jgi:type IV pilus assembly protein PilM
MNAVLQQAKGALQQALDSMRPKLSLARSYPIGLHLGDERLNVAQMQQTPSGIAFRAVASAGIGCGRDELLADPRRFKQAVKRVWAEHPFSGKDVVACMPHDQLKVFTVTYATAEGQSDAEAVVREIKERVKGNPEDLVVDFVPVRQAEYDDPVREAMVAVAAREHVTAYLDLLFDAGLTVSALDIGPMALRRVVPWANKGERGEMRNVLLVNVGSGCSYLTVVWGRRLMLDRAVEFSEHRLLSRLKTMLDLPEPTAKRLLVEHGFAAGPPAEGAVEFSAALKEVLRGDFLALKAEVNKTLIYAASKTRGETVDRIFLVGSAARYRGIAELMSQELSKPVDLLDPLEIFPHRLTQDGLAALWPHSDVAVATGLALRGVDGIWQN